MPCYRPENCAHINKGDINMANICKNYLSITDYDNENEILELLNKDKEAIIELLKTGMPEFRIYIDDFGAATLEKDTKEIFLIFESAWGGNPEGVQALSSNPLLENALVKYSRKVEGDTSTAKWFFKNGNSVNSKGEIETASVPSQDIINKVELLFQGLEELLAEASELCEQIDMAEVDLYTLVGNDDSIGTFCMINITRYEILIRTFEDWKNGDIKTLADVDMAGLAGVDDEGDLEYDEDEKVNDNYFKEWLSDINDEIPIKLTVQKMKKIL